MTPTPGRTPFAFFYNRNDIDPFTQKPTGVAVPGGLAISVTTDKGLRVNWERVKDYVEMTDLDEGQIPPLSPFATRDTIRWHAERMLEFQMRAFAAALLALKEGRVEEISV